MKRTEFLVDDVKRGAQSQLLSDSGVSDLEILHYLNSAQDRIFARILQLYPYILMAESTIDIVAGTEAYALPSDAFLGAGLSFVEFKYGGGSGDYRKLKSDTIQNRVTNTTSRDPVLYIRRGNYILLNPVPSASITSGLRITYQRKVRALDIRRGVISSASKTGSTLNTITIDLTPTLAKDEGTVTAARDVLNKLDWICIVNKNGTVVVEAIPISGYDTSTGVITVDSGFTTTVSAASMVDQYIVGGSYTTTNGELPEGVERYLVAYATFKLLRRLGSLTEPEFQRQELQAIESDLMDSFKNIDSDSIKMPLDDIWRSDYYGL